MTAPKDPKTPDGTQRPLGPAAARAAASGTAPIGAGAPPAPPVEAGPEVTERLETLPPSGIPVFRVTRGSGRHWLDEPGALGGVWVVSILVLLATVAAEFAVDYHLKFHADEIPGFAAIFGILACVALVLGSKVLGIFLKRKDDYYDD